MRVLALDLSSTSGAAFDGPDGTPRFSTLKGRLQPHPNRDDFRELYGNLIFWLEDLCRFQRPDLIVIEAPWVPFNMLAGKETERTFGREPREHQRSIDLVIMQLLIGLAANVEGWASSRRDADGNPAPIDCAKGQVASVRKFFTGSGRSKKIDVQQRCALLGWRVMDDHQADAAALWAWAKATTDPLFQIIPGRAVA